jgi:hypothetical protein
MGKLKKSEFYWTKERCIESALEYNRRNEWRHKKPLAYKIARKNGWFDECTAHMGKLKKSEFYWTKEKCFESALEYNRRTHWMQKRPLAYKTARKNNWLEECTAHMENLRKMKSYWTKEKCIESAMKYKRKYEWRKKEKGAYYAARENNWFEECVEHMVKDLKWTKEKCIASAVKFNTKTDWINSEGHAYAAARKYNWLTECTAHMICQRKSNKNLSKKRCFESAKIYA